MNVAGIGATWLALCLAAWGFTSALAATPTRPSLRASAERALVTSAFAAAVATFVLVYLLATTQLDTSFVAAHITRTLSRWDRIGALWSAPPGATLVAAALVGAAGGWEKSRGGQSLGIAVSSATVVALLASSIAATPFATLGWHPAEGLGLSPSAQEWTSLLAGVTLTGAVAAASRLAAFAANAMGEGTVAPVTEGFHARLTTTVALLVVASVADAHGGVVSGMRMTLAPNEGIAAVLVPVLVVATLAWRAGGAPPLATLLAAVGLLGTCVATVLGDGGRVLPLPLLVLKEASVTAAALGALSVALQRRTTGARLVELSAVIALTLSAMWMLAQPGQAGTPLAPLALALIVAGTTLSAVASATRANSTSSLMVALLTPIAGGLAMLPLVGRPNEAVLVGALAGAALGAMFSRGTERGPLRPTPRALLLLALVAAAIGAAGNRAARTQRLELKGGGRGTVSGRFGTTIDIAHQGVSHFDRAGMHVVAVGLDILRGNSARFHALERRDYVDSRETVLASGVARPVVVNTPLEQFRLSIDELHDDEAVSLRVLAIPFAWMWSLSAMIAVIAAIVSRLRRSASQTSRADTGGTANVVR